MEPHYYEKDDRIRKETVLPTINILSFFTMGNYLGLSKGGRNSDVAVLVR